MNTPHPVPTVDTILNGIYNAIGIKRNLLGSLYLKDAVKTVLLHPQCVRRQVTKTLYPLVAAHFHTNASCVERAIRNVIAQCCARHAPTLNRYFRTTTYSPSTHPTNAEFIALLVDYVYLGLCAT